MEEQTDKRMLETVCKKLTWYYIINIIDIDIGTVA